MLQTARRERGIFAVPFDDEALADSLSDARVTYGLLDVPAMPCVARDRAISGIEKAHRNISHDPMCNL